MSIADSDQQAHYNEVAIRHAAALHEHRRRARHDDAQAMRSLDEMAPHNRPAVGVAREWDAMGRQSVSDELDAQAADHGVRFEHVGLTLGTVLHGIDLRQVPGNPALTWLVRTTLLERKVIFFRDQHLDEAEHIAFARSFGELDAFPFGKPGEDPFILSIEHDERSPGNENGWHTDVTWMERPSLGSIAQLMECPPVGGDTLFADSHAAYLGLPDNVRSQIEHLDGINDYRLFLASYRGGLPAELADGIKADIPFGVVHPLVRTHPETGKQALYIHGGFLRHDSLTDRRTGQALDPGESKRVVKQLLAQHTRPEYSCRFEWQEGSIAFWDNRAVQHYAASDYYPHRRVLRRVTVAGDRPYFEASPLA